MYQQQPDYRQQVHPQDGAYYHNRHLESAPVQRHCLNSSLMSIQMNPNHHSEEHRLQHRKRRVKSLLVLAGISVLSVILMDGMIQFMIFDWKGEGFVEDGGGRQLVEEGQWMVESSLSSDNINDMNSNVVNNLVNNNIPLTIDSPRTNQQSSHLHRFSLLPKHALLHRRRRELIAQQKPIPLHLRDDFDDTMHHRRRMYPMIQDKTMDIVDKRIPPAKQTRGKNRNRRTQQQKQQAQDRLYETGALYQGYGTHYLDLWIGTPPQRQTVILDTGSSITAFPCQECQHCGEENKIRFHLDQVFHQEESSTFRQQDCGGNSQECDIGTCIEKNHPYCQLAVAYAEGSSWTAVEGSDVLYPGGCHEIALEDGEERKEYGVGLGMEDLGGNGGDFDWGEFRLEFGCQTKVCGFYA